MLRIRLTRTGRKKRPSYRVVVAEARWARDGRSVDTLGHYNPLTDPSTIVLDVERTEQWIRKGAQPTERVRKLLDIARAAQPATTATAVETPAAKPEVPAAAEAAVESQAKPAPKATARATAKTKAKATAKTKSKAKSSAKSKAKTKSAAKAVAKGKAKSQTKAAAAAKSKAKADGT